MSVPKRYSSYGSLNYYFLNFPSREDLDIAGKTALDKFISTGGISVGKYTQERLELTAKQPKFDVRNFYGLATDLEEMNAGKFTEFIDKKLLSKAFDVFELILPDVDMGGALKKRRIIITDDTRGIFDFSLASKGLYQLMEYFSAELAADSPFEFINLLPGLVEPDMVQKDQLDQFYYVSPTTDKKYFLVQQQKGTVAIQLKVKDAHLEFATTVKKSYLMFQKKGGKQRKVDLYVGIGGLRNLTYEGMLSRAMPVLLAAKILEKEGIQTRITALRLYDNDEKYSKFNVFGLTYKIKDFGQDLDFNFIALNCCDPRWFRWNLWRFSEALFLKEYDVRTFGAGSTIYGGTKLDETFTRYKNWYFGEVDKGNIEFSGINRDLMLTGGLTNPSNNFQRQKTEIITEFNRILDTVDFQFNAVEKVAQRIYDRDVESKRVSLSSYKSYCISILSRTYGFASSGDYATPEMEQDRLIDEFSEKMELLTHFFETKNAFE